MKPVNGRNIAALMNPRLAVLVTCCDRNHRPNVLTVAWHTPLSHEPPLVGISIAHTRYSHALIADTGEFAINIVGEGMLAAVRMCGMYTGELDDKFQIAHLQTRPAQHICAPVLEPALGVLECRLADRLETGDHTFFVGQVLHAQARGDYFTDRWSSQNGDSALQCLQRDDFGTFLEMDADNRTGA